MRMIRYTSRKLEKERKKEKAVQVLQVSIEKVVDSIKILTGCATVKRNRKYITGNLGRVQYIIE